MRSVLGSIAAAIILVACGAPPDNAPADAPQEPDASADAGAGVDGGADAGAGADADAMDAAPHSDAAAHTDASPKPDANVGNGCPALVYPSGVKLQTFKDAATTASYAHHLGSGEKAPECFLDANNLVDPDTGHKYDLTVQVATNFQLQELVGTEIAQGYGHFVLMAPSAVAALEKFRQLVNTPVSVISGFRSPKHQEAVCNGLCGNPLGCPGTCANNSRHMFGDAFDLPLDFYTSADQQRACDAGFKFSYLESGTHLHVDQNPAYATCVKQ